MKIKIKSTKQFGREINLSATHLSSQEKYCCYPVNKKTIQAKPNRRQRDLRCNQPRNYNLAKNDKCRCWIRIKNAGKQQAQCDWKKEPLDDIFLIQKDLPHNAEWRIKLHQEINEGDKNNGNTPEGYSRDCSHSKYINTILEVIEENEVKLKGKKPEQMEMVRWPVLAPCFTLMGMGDGSPINFHLGLHNSQVTEM